MQRCRRPSRRLTVGLADGLGSRGLVPHYARWFAGLGVRPSTPILDIGAGGGHLLVNMAIQGFSDLLGIDPYLARERRERPVRLLRSSCEELDESFAIVMINHTLEHVPEPVATLIAARERLAPGGRLIVRVPAYDSRNADHYRTDWVHWDAPRHLQVPTTAGLEAACTDANLRLVRSCRDGHALGFWGSEQYRIGIPLRDPRSWDEDPAASPFSSEQIAAWKRQARELNAAERGDAVTFVLAPAG